jgi:hypothetical protein
MTAKKYAELVKPLSFRGNFMGARANARLLTFMTGDKLCGLDMNFILGVYDYPGDWAPNRGSHVHPFTEYLLFFGYDPQDMNYLGAELTLAMGGEWEIGRITRPSIVIAPENLPHCPLITEKVEKPFGHLHLAMSATYSGERAVDKQGDTDGTKYAHLFKEFKVVPGPGGADAEQLITISGADGLEGYALNFQMGLYKAAGRWQEGPHSHPYDEIMVFFGHKTDDMTYLGAEITIELGEEHEQHTFDRTTVVVIPKGTVHFPVTVNKVEYPFRMACVGLAAAYESIPAK